MIKLGVAGFIIALLVLVVLFPWAVIWALNTLFPTLAIPFTFWTWSAWLLGLSVFYVLATGMASAVSGFCFLS